MFGDAQEAVEVEARGEEEEEDLGEVRSADTISIGTFFSFGLLIFHLRSPISFSNSYISRSRWCPTSMKKALEQLTKHCFRERDPLVSRLLQNPLALALELLDCWDLW